MNIQKTSEHLDYIINKTGIVLIHYNKSEVNTVPYFYLGLIERIKASCIGLKIMVENLDKTPELEFSAGLVVRTVILDFFMGLNGYSKHETARQAGISANKQETELKEFCNRILADGLRWTIKHLESFKAKDFYSDEQLERAYAKLTALYPTFLERIGTDVPKIRFDAPETNTKLFTALAVKSKLKELSRNYEIYDFYSKYEHFSIMSFSLMRRPDLEQFTTLQKAVELIVLHLYFSTSMLREYLPIEDGFIKHANEDIGKYIHSKIFDTANGG
jgi:hypothetical protein